MKKSIALMCTALLLAACSAHADSVKLNYQGRLRQKGGPLVNGNVNMSFRMYTNETGGVCIYEESNLVTVVDGVYSVVLGKNPVMGDLEDAIKDDNAHLEVVINGNPLRPREKFTPPGFAKKSTEHWRMFSKGDFTSTNSPQNIAGAFMPGYAQYGHSWELVNTSHTWMFFPPVWEKQTIEKISYFRVREEIQENPTCNLEPFINARIVEYTGEPVRTVTVTNTLMKGLPVGEWLDLPLVTNVVLQPGQLLMLEGHEERARDNLPIEGSYCTTLYIDVQVK